MKKALSYIAVAALAAGFTACDDNFERPPMIVPPSPDIEPTATIQDVKTDYWQYVEGTPQTIGLNENGDSIIIKGRICSSDVTGNIYKNLIVQTVDASGQQIALTFAVNNNKLYNTYKFGQEIYINLTGLDVGGYRGLMQFGQVGASGMGFMESDLFDSHAFTSGLPNPAAVDTAYTTAADLAALKAQQESLMLWQSRLVCVKDVEFEEPGEVFAGSANTNRYIKDAQGNRIIVRNSAYASFKNERIPSGKGNVAGILSYFGSDWQILLIDEEGCIGFEGSSDKPEPEPEPGTGTDKLSQNFDASTDIPTGWTTYKVKGDKAWYIASFNNNNYASMTGYKGTAPFDSWIVTPAINLGNNPEKTLSFDTQVNGYGSKTTTFKVFAMTTNDPATAELTELTATWPTAPESGYSSWVNSGTIDLSKFEGTFYIGWQYAAASDENYATWCLDNVLVGTKGGDTPEPPVTEGTLYSFLKPSLSEMPSDWVIENVSLGDGMSYIWSWKVYQEAGYLNASGYVNGAAQACEGYAISPEINLDGVTEAKLSFDHAAKFQTTLTSLCGIVAREVGTTEWIALAIPTWPEAGSWSFANSGEISLGAFEGKKIQVAFKYGSSAAGADTWEIKNLNISGKK